MGTLLQGTRLKSIYLWNKTIIDDFDHIETDLAEESWNVPINDDIAKPIVYLNSTSLWVSNKHYTHNYKDQDQSCGAAKVYSSNYKRSSNNGTFSNKPENKIKWKRSSIASTKSRNQDSEPSFETLPFDLDKSLVKAKTSLTAKKNTKSNRLTVESKGINEQNIYNGLKKFKMLHKKTLWHETEYGIKQSTNRNPKLKRSTTNRFEYFSPVKPNYFKVWEGWDGSKHMPKSSGFRNKRRRSTISNKGQGLRTYSSQSNKTNKAGNRNAGSTGSLRYFVRSLSTHKKKRSNW